MQLALALISPFKISMLIPILYLIKSLIFDSIAKFELVCIGHVVS
jgi:hypothetical protein